MTTYNQLHINHFNPYHLFNFLTAQKITPTSLNDFCIETQFIQITPDYIISMLTGEILLEIPQNDSILDYIEIIPAIHLATKKESEDNGWDPPPTPSFNDFEYTDDEIMECGGCFQGKGMMSYEIDGIRKHTCTMDRSGQYGATIKTAEIVDAISGKVTDQFYGSWNDFNLTFAAKAAKGVKFFLYVFGKGKRVPIQQAKFYIDNGNVSYAKCGEKMNGCAEVVIRSNKLGQWQLVSWKDM